LENRNSIWCEDIDEDEGWMSFKIGFLKIQILREWSELKDELETMKKWRHVERRLAIDEHLLAKVIARSIHNSVCIWPNRKWFFRWDAHRESTSFETSDSSKSQGTTEYAQYVSKSLSRSESHGSQLIISHKFIVGSFSSHLVFFSLVPSIPCRWISCQSIGSWRSSLHIIDSFSMPPHANIRQPVQSRCHSSSLPMWDVELSQLNLARAIPPTRIYLKTVTWPSHRHVLQLLSPYSSVFPPHILSHKSTFQAQLTFSEISHNHILCEYIHSERLIPPIRSHMIPCSPFDRVSVTLSLLIWLFLTAFTFLTVHIYNSSTKTLS
jgi:hypothetical protein